MKLPEIDQFCVCRVDYSNPQQEMAMNEPLRPTIARIWCGRTTTAKANDYARYLQEHGIEPLAQKALAVQMLREERSAETEFVTISYWESVEAMSRFAGRDPRQIHQLERDAEFLIELPERVQILEIVVSFGPTGEAPQPPGAAA